jgi:hypothetical protein
MQAGFDDGLGGIDATGDFVAEIPRARSVTSAERGPDDTIFQGACIARSSSAFMREILTRGINAWR